MRRFRSVTTMLCLGACLSAGGTVGCVADLNERAVIGTRPTASFGGETGPGAAGAGTLDRRRWRTTVVVAPIDGVVHTEPFRMVRPVSRRAPAERAGAFPFSTPPGGLGGSGGSQAWEALQEMGRSAADVVWGPARGWRAVRGGRAGWWTWSPVEIWKRTRGDRTRWSAVGGVRTEHKEEADGTR